MTFSWNFCLKLHYSRYKHPTIRRIFGSVDENVGCHWKNIEINNDCIVKSALELDIDPDDEKNTFELDPLEFEEILKNIEVNSEHDIPGHNQHSIKPLRFNKRDPRLCRLYGEKKI